MLLHKLGEDLVLALKLLLEEGDPPVLGVAGASGAGLERGRGVLEELLLPAVEHRRVDGGLVTEIRNRGMFGKAKPQNLPFACTRGWFWESTRDIFIQVRWQIP